MPRILIALACLVAFPNLVLARCQQIVQESEIYLAASSEERGYYLPETQGFKDELSGIIEGRAHKICKVMGCGPLLSHSTQLYNKPIMIAMFPDDEEMDADIFVRVVPWKYANNGHKKLGNAMWYGGHTLTMVAIVSALSYWPWFEGIPTLVAPAVVIASQIVTMSSRMIERMDPSEIDAQSALRRMERNERVNKIPLLKQKKKVPHQIFSSIICAEPPSDGDLEVRYE